jgi:hypothetical protein
MRFRMNQKGGKTPKIKLLLLFFLILFCCATAPIKTYDETVSEWKSYKDVAKWMSSYFSYDMRRFDESMSEWRSYKKYLSIRTPQETFELKSGVCFDATRFAKETLNRIDPSYEAEIVFIVRDIHPHFACSFQKDGKLYIMDYGATYQSLIGVHGPYNSLGEYWKFLELNGPPGVKIRNVKFGWPKGMEKHVK